MAWSRISSKVIATPPYARAAVKVRARACRSLLGTLVPQMVGNEKWKVWEQTPPHSPAPGVHLRCYLGLFFGGETPDITSRTLPQRPSGPAPILLTKLRHAADTYLERRSPAQA
jgi:hypothetical protein